MKKELKNFLQLESVEWKGMLFNRKYKELFKRVVSVPDEMINK